MRAGVLMCLAATWALGVAGPPTSAGAATDGRQLAASCAGCHLIEGSGTPASAGGIPRITGLPAGEIVSRMLAYRSDDTSSQVMHIVCGALSKEEITAIAQYLAADRSAGSP